MGLKPAVGTSRRHPWRSAGLLLLALAMVLAVLKLTAVSSLDMGGDSLKGRQSITLADTGMVHQSLSQSPAAAPVPEASPRMSSPAVIEAQASRQVPPYAKDITDLVPGKVRSYVNPSAYLDTSTIQDPELLEAHQAIRKHVASSAYKQRVQEIEKANLTGIVIPAGGARLTVNLIVTLKVLREHFKCTLPIEVMWQGHREMDRTTWGNIESMFKPIRGVDISKVPHPVPRMHIKDLPLTRYTGKVYSLLISEFRYVLMVDADSMPVQDPHEYFRHPQFQATGNLFWPDAWHGLVKDEAYKSFGVSPDRARRIGTEGALLASGAVLFAGKGYTELDTESGQLLMDRVKHLDVLEYLLWVNSIPSILEGFAWGDKDTFGIAFAAAGKAHMFSQVPVPPAGIFAWHKDMLLVKASGAKQWGWQLLGFLQHDSWGRPAFIHRTINKFNPSEDPWPLELITAPMPKRWSSYFLAHVNHGPTKGVPWDYVVPNSSVTMLSLEPDSPIAQWVHGAGDQLIRDIPFPPGGAWPKVQPSETCRDPDSFLRRWAMKESGLPVDLLPQRHGECQDVLKDVLGSRTHDQYRRKGWLMMPSMRYLDEAHMSALPFNWRAGEAATPLPAWKANFSDPQLAEDPFVQAVNAAYQAYYWMRSNLELFPVVHA